MAQLINTNMQSLKAQRNLATSQKALGVTLERLSTGLRINSAKDDAAGLAISERFSSQIKGLNQAIRNANDGVSLTQTAESALGTLSENVQRIRELAVQSANGSNSAADRKALDNEVQALISEVQRVALNTEFNGQSILNGSQNETFFQVGAQQGQMIAVQGMDVRTSKLGGQEYVGTPYDETKPSNNGDGFTQDEITEIATNGQIGPMYITGQDAITGPPPTPPTIDSTKVFVKSDAAYSLEEAVSNLNKAIQEEIDKGGAKGKMIAEMDLKASLRVMNDGTTKMVVSSALNPDSQGNNQQLIALGGLITSRPGKTLDTDLVTQEAVIGYIVTPIEDRYLESKTLDELDILTRESASQAIGIADAALNQINSIRADIGAVQTRFEQAIVNLQTSSDNMSAARSRISDADFAAETAELTRVQILQQAGISVLSQANSSPQSALALLQ